MYNIKFPYIQQNPQIIKLFIVHLSISNWLVICIYPLGYNLYHIPFIIGYLYPIVISNVYPILLKSFHLESRWKIDIYKGRKESRKIISVGTQLSDLENEAMKMNKYPKWKLFCYPKKWKPIQKWKTKPIHIFELHLFNYTRIYFRFHWQFIYVLSFLKCCQIYFKLDYSIDFIFFVCFFLIQRLFLVALNLCAFGIFIYRDFSWDRYLKFMKCDWISILWNEK